MMRGGGGGGGGSNRSLDSIHIHCLFLVGIETFTLSTFSQLTEVVGPPVFTLLGSSPFPSLLLPPFLSLCLLSALGYPHSPTYPLSSAPLKLVVLHRQPPTRKTTPSIRLFSPFPFKGFRRATKKKTAQFQTLQ